MRPPRLYLLSPGRLGVEVIEAGARRTLEKGFCSADGLEQLPFGYLGAEAIAELELLDDDAAGGGEAFSGAIGAGTGDPGDAYPAVAEENDREGMRLEPPLLDPGGVDGGASIDDVPE